MQGEYLTKIVELSDIITGKLNLIESPCGSGKTTFAKEKLITLNHENNMLYLIDTANGKEQLLQSKGAVQRYNEWTDEYEWRLPGISVMTYAGYATLCDKAPECDQWFRNALIVCDEMHNLIKWSRWGNNNTIHRQAVQLLRERIIFGKNKVTALSATPDAIIDEFVRDDKLNFVELHGEPRHYETFETHEYHTLSMVLNNLVPQKRGIIFIPHIHEIKKYQSMLETRGIPTAAIWSISNEEHQMDDEQLDIRDYVLQYREIPDDIDILLINRSCETSITIGSEKDTRKPIDFMIIHSTDKDTQIQVRGRYRADLPEMYLLNPEATDKIILPDEWLDKPLNKEDKQRLCIFLHIPSKSGNRTAMWSTVKPQLESSGYTVTEHRSMSERYSIITKAA